MSCINWGDRKIKEVIRTMATRNIDNRYAKVALMIPGEQILCLKKAMKNKLIRVNETMLHIVEKDWNIANTIEKQIKELGWKNSSYNLYHCGLHEVQLPKTTKIDYAFFDVCDSITPDIIRWMYDNQNRFTTTARIGFTFRIHIRHGRRLPDEINKTLTYEQHRECLIHLLNAKNNNWIADTFGLVRVGSSKATVLVGWTNQQEIMRATFASILCAFSNSSIHLRSSIKYKEKGQAQNMNYLEINLKPLSKMQKQTDRFKWISHLIPELILKRKYKRRIAA